MTAKVLKIIAIIVILGLLTIGGAVAWGYSQLQPVNPSDTATQRFVIAKGQSVIKTANSLKEAGLVKNAQIFRFYAQYKNLDTKMQAGSYELSPNMTTQQIADTLTQGSEDIWITLLEGWRVEEVSAYLAAQDLSEFDKAAFDELASTSEGSIFPDSYLVPKESTAEQLYELFISTFERKVVTDLEEEITASGKELSEIITFASIVEREGRSFEDMRHVAGILQNRLDIGMPLQADATLQYIAGYNAVTQDWWSPPSVAVKTSTSPYNTYLQPGMPPYPICNPSLNAIKAVLDPIASDDLFYIHDQTGVAHYSETLEEHNANIDKYLR